MKGWHFDIKIEGQYEMQYRWHLQIQMPNCDKKWNHNSVSDYWSWS